MALGYNVLVSNTAISRNIAIGNYAMENANNSTTFLLGNNIAIGYAALQGSSSPSANTGEGNIAIGSSALNVNSSGIFNTAIGNGAMLFNNTGERNVAIGAGTLGLNTIGSFNTAVGQGALLTNKAESKNTAIGFGALQNGSSATSASDGFNTAVGYEALKGVGTGNLNLGKYNTGIGADVLKSNTTGNENTSLGYATLAQNTTGNQNLGVGIYALNSNTEGSNNLALGTYAGISNSEGDQNIAIGSSALYFNETGSNNVAIGTSAGINTKGDANVFVGYKAGELETGVSSNKLYINNSGQTKDSALIYGEFDNNYVRMNANVEGYGFTDSKPAVSGIQIYTSNNPFSFTEGAGVYGESISTIDRGIGVRGVGNLRGLRGESISSVGTNFGVGGNAITATSGQNFGVYGAARNGIENYSIYGENPGSGVNDWAGYFNGRVFANESVITNAVEFDSNTSGTGDGNKIEHAVQIKYIICTNGLFPNQDDGDSGTGQSSDALLGEVKMFAGNFPPDGWLFCDGTELQISNYNALFSLLGPRYGGNGTSTFRLPNLVNAVPIHYTTGDPNH